MFIYSEPKLLTLVQLELRLVLWPNPATSNQSMFDETGTGEMMWNAPDVSDCITLSPNSVMSALITTIPIQEIGSYLCPGAVLVTSHPCNTDIYLN